VFLGFPCHPRAYVLRRLCPACVCRGSWKDATFKEYNFQALGLPTAGGVLHPLLKVIRTGHYLPSPSCCAIWAMCSRAARSWCCAWRQVRSQFRKIFTQMGFEEMPTNNYVENSFWNFDALFQPQQHPARDAHDTFFLTSELRVSHEQCPP
jgi:phenylalanyl-tRNA synthetase alpha chain